MKKCLFLGCNGYIGKHLCHYLKIYGYTVISCDIQQESDLDNYWKVDVTNPNELERLDYDVDLIFWFSGLTGTFESFTKADSFIQVNELGLLNLLNILKDKITKPRIIFPSTRLVYKGQECALSEGAEKDPKTIYGINKLACEYYLKTYNQLFDISYTVYRICVPYGNMFSEEYSYGTVGFFISRALRGDNITLYGDGSLRRTFTHIYDLCHQIIYSCNKQETLNKIVNIGGENLSLYEVALIIAQQYGVDIEFTEWPIQAKLLESGSTFFDDTFIQQILGGYTYKQLTEQNWNE